MKKGALGRTYSPGEVIIRQGEVGDCMYVIQDGAVDIIRREGDSEIKLATRGAGEFVGEMALFERQVRSAEVRAVGDVRVLTVDRKNLMTRINEDPSLAFRLIETLAHRVRELSEEMARLRRDA